MPTQSLEQRAEQEIVDFLIGHWNPSNALGYDPAVEKPSAEAFLPVATSIDNVGAVYPSLVVSFSNETTGGQTTYDFVTSDGPGQTRNGTVLATTRAQDRTADEPGYVGDSSAYSAVDAEAIDDVVLDEVERICQDNALAPGTDFSHLGSQPGPDAPDDFEGGDVVRLAQTQISYGWLRAP